MIKKAFTLIELLVTIVLFSLLLAVALYSFRFASMDIKSINNTNPQEAIDYYMIRRAIHSLYPLVDIDKNETNQLKAVHYFFNGDKEECSFITDRGVFFNGVVLGHLYFKENQLLYEEGKIFDKGIDYKELYKIPFLHKVSILKNIDKLEFSYLSLDNRLYSNYKNNIPISISIKFIQNKKSKKYYFFVGIDNQRRKSTVLQDREGF